MGNARGIALPAALLLLLLATTLVAATLLFTVLDTKGTQSVHTENQAFGAAEAGLLNALSTINRRGIINFQNDVVNSGNVSTALTTLPNYSNLSYRVTGLVAGANSSTSGSITVGGYAPLTAEHVITAGLQRGSLNAGPGALHLSNDTAVGTFAGNSMTIDGNNWVLTDLTSNIANQDNTRCLNNSCPRPAISTRNDTVTASIITALAGQGTIIGFGTTPSVRTTAAASTADLLRFVNDILVGNGAPNGCDGNNTGNNDYWRNAVHCVPKTKGNQGNNQTPDFWGTLTTPNVTYVLDQTARLAGGSNGAGVLIFAQNVNFNGNFTFCGWVLFMNPSANGIQVGGNVSIYGEVMSPLPAFGGNGGIVIKYSWDCLLKADSAGVNGGGNIPKPVAITSWSD